MMKARGLEFFDVAGQTVFPVYGADGGLFVDQVFFLVDRKSLRAIGVTAGTGEGTGRRHPHSRARCGDRRLPEVGHTLFQDQSERRSYATGDPLRIKDFHDSLITHSSAFRIHFVCRCTCRCRRRSLFWGWRRELERPALALWRGCGQRRRGWRRRAGDTGRGQRRRFSHRRRG